MTQQSPLNYRILLQEAWQEMRQMRLELESLTAQTIAPQAAPIAIIGMNCRFPGGANSPEAYWDLLQNGVDAITEVPPDRWNLSVYYDSNPDAPGKLYSRHGGFIDQVDQFDPQFFGISPREAISLDPQQRLLLEVSYGALERAGQAVDQLRGSRTGVYIGISFEDYAKFSLHSGDLSRIDAHSSLGNTRSIAVGRLAYVLGLQGPTMQLDTTCSSSLLAVHLACQSLRSGESNLALAGGVNLMLTPEPTIGFCKLKALSPDGYCRTFDANANGYVRGEGCGIVVLKRLDAAIADRDPILAIIRGSAVNHDGQSNGLTAPNGQAQEAVIQQAIQQAGVAAAQIQYVEAHGTGTPLGDPIEVLALSKALGERSVDNPLWIGSVKTNMGHLESAAGVASLIKTVLALQHQQIPPHLHFQQPNSYIPWQKLAIKVPTQLTSWHSESPRLAGVSSFGMSGTNVHMILEEFVKPPVETATDAVAPLQLTSQLTPQLFTLSAKTQPALKQLAERYEEFLKFQSDELLPDICFTANTGRSQFEYRFATSANSINQLRQKLRQYIQTGTLEPLPESLTQRYLQGKTIDWNLDYSELPRRVVLPTYPFQKQRYWLEPPVLNSNGSNTHPLLGKRLALAKSAAIHFEAELHPNHPAFLQQHCVFGQPIMPMAGYAEMALAAGQELLQSTQISTQMALELTIHQPLALERAMTVQLVLTQQQQGYAFEVFASLPPDNAINSQWQRHASGSLRSVSPSSVSPSSVSPSSNQDAQVSLKSIATSTANFTELNVERFYQTYQQHGIEYGAAFRGIRQLWQGKQAAIAQIELPAIGSGSTSGSPYLLHPILLDAALQTVATALPSQSQTYLPISIERLVIHAAHSSQLPIWSEAVLRVSEDAVHPIADLRLLDEAGQLLVSIAGLKLCPAQLEPSKSADWKSTGWQDWLYQVKWQPQPLHQSRLPRLSQVGHKFVALTDALLANQAQSLIQYQTLLAQLESLSLTYIVQALLKLGWQFAVDDYFSVQQVIQQLAISADRKFVQRLLDILVEAGFLNRTSGDRYCVIQALEPVTSSAGVQLANSPELILLQRCGSALAEQLQGQRDPVQLLFPDGDLTILSQIYQESPGAQFTNQLMQQVVESVLPQRKIRILEIGGGTGGTTSYLLSHLDSQTANYTFTDVSPLFIQKAQQKFSAYDFVQYRALDIEKPPQSQGFSSQQYDLVIAANVLHATQNLETSLTHIRQLLASDGMLILLEGVYPMRWLDLTFGLTNGWWRFTDYSLRSNYPLISVEQWQSVLPSCGFESVKIHPVVDGSVIQQAVIVAQANRAVESTLSDFDWLIVADLAVNPAPNQQELAQALAHCLEAGGASYRISHPGSELVISFDRPTQILFLAALDAPDPAELISELLEATAETICSSALGLIQSLVQLLGSRQSISLALVTRAAVATGAVPEQLSGLAQSLLWGIGKTLRVEHPELNCVCIDLDASQDVAQQAAMLLAEFAPPAREPEVAFRRQRHVARLMRSSSDSLNHSQKRQLFILQRGTLDNLQLRTVERPALRLDEVEIQVQASGLNFRDLLNTLDLYPGEAGLLGCECVGEISAVGEQVTSLKPGDRVMGVASGSFSNWVTVNAAMVVPVPASLSSEAAATLPVAFLTADYALRLAQLKRGERVLIHAAAGGVGQAAIQIAQQLGAEIYATASPEKWNAIQNLGVNYLFNSRSLEFATELMRLTQGEGVDLVLNSLSGEFIPQSLSVLRPGGRFVELGKTDWSAEQVQARYPGLQYFQIDLVELCQQPDLIQVMLQDIVRKIQDNIYQPLPYRTFPVTKAVQAFRTMQQAKHIGKLVITQPARVDAHLPAQIHSNSSYLITGGLGGLGLLVAEWLVQQGARHLVLLSRRIPETAVPQIQAWEQAGVQVMTAPIDVADRVQLAELLSLLESSLPPLRGIVHAAGVLEDGMLHQQTWKKFAVALRPKLLGAWNLHQMTQAQPLDFYVMFSSATALFGSPGQANHAAANVFLDTLAHYRQSLNSPALSINWGIWSEVGAAAVRQTESRLKGIQLKGIQSISPAQGIAAFANLFAAPFTQIGVIPIQWQEFLQQEIASPFLAEFLAEKTCQAVLPQSEILQALQTASAPERRSRLQAYLCQQIAQVLGFQPAELNLQKGFFDLGMDSLTSVELKNRLQTDLDCKLPATVAFDYPTIEALTDYLTASVTIQENTSENYSELEIESQLESEMDEALDKLSQAELAELLAQELSEMGGRIA